MNHSLVRPLRKGSLTAVCGAVLLLAACGGDDSNTATPTAVAPTTATALAMNQIDTQTCDSNEPQAINGLSLSDDQDQTDVSMLMPACTTY